MSGLDWAKQHNQPINLQGNVFVAYIYTHLDSSVACLQPSLD